MSGQGLESIKLEKHFPVEECEPFAKQIDYIPKNRSNVQEIGQSIIFVTIKIFFDWQNRNLWAKHA